MANYWQDRRFQLLNQMEADEKKLNDRLAKIYEQQEALLKREIAAYYAQYGENNVIEYRRLLADLSADDRKLLMERMEEFAAKYPQYAHLLPVRESIYRLDRLEGLQYSIWLQQMEIGAIEQSELTAHFESYAQRAANLAAEELGFGSNFYAINSGVITATVGVAWSQGKDFSERIWENRDKLAAYLNDDLAKGFARGLNYEKMAKMLMERFDNVSKRDAMRLIYTEGTFLFNEAQAQVHEQQFEFYQLSTITDPKTCEVCKGVEQAQKAEPMAFKDRKPGVNFPPMHPNCVMGDMRLLAPGMESMTRSYYSGEIVELRTANGRRLAVTPNHIVLTSRGWVRAKFIVEGDQVINYTGGVIADVESAPTQYDSVTTVEEDFRSFVESGTVTTHRMPAAPEYFKGDVIPDSEVDIVFINGFLGNEGDALVSEYVGDGDFIGAGIGGETPLTGQRSMAKLLVGISLASDGIMSGSSIARIIRSGALTHHELVSLCDIAHYDTRLAQSALNGGSGEAEALGDSFNADARFIQGDHFGNGKKRTHGNGPNSENIRDFVDAFSGVVEFDDVVSVGRFQFTGHVYDASTESRTYVCNGIITSNCRCSYTVAVPDWDAWIEEYVAKHGGDYIQERDRPDLNYLRPEVSQAVNDPLRDLKDNVGIAHLGLRHVVDKKVFEDALDAAKRSNKNGGSVDWHSAEEMAGWDTMLSTDKMAGVAVKEDGDITCVFKNSNSHVRGAVTDLILTARENGGVKMDCYGRFLVNSYEKCGYEVVARVPFDPQYVVDPLLLEERPDVYFLKRNGNSTKGTIRSIRNKTYHQSTQEELDALPTFDYDKAWEYRDSLL